MANGRYMRGDWGAKPNFYERANVARQNKFLRDLAQGRETIDGLSRDLAARLMRQVTQAEPFAEAREWAILMNAHLEGHEIEHMVATAINSRRAILITRQVDIHQLSSGIHQVVRIDMLNTGPERDPPDYEIDFIVRGNSWADNNDVTMFKISHEPVHDRINGHRVHGVSAMEFSALMEIADRYR